MEPLLKNNQIIVELQEAMGSDRAIANAAWTSSFNKASREQKTYEQVNQLVQRLAKDGHSTPFESVVLRFWMRIPIFTDRQIMTHRIASHNGLSGRYRTMPMDYYKIPEDVLEIFDKARQFKCSTDYLKNYQDSCELAVKNYQTALDSLKPLVVTKHITNEEYKRCREILRGQLPTAGMTERTSIFNLRSFANFQRLRNSEHAQPEIKQVAEMMLEEVKKANICPIAIKALQEKNWMI